MSVPKISIICNAYNAEAYLAQTIESAIAQTETDWELIFWDNQSIDETADIVKSYSDKRIRYFYAPNFTPLGEARNLAMEKATGDLMCFLDSDDFWEPTFLAELSKLFSNPYVGLAYANGWRYFQKTGQKKLLYKKPQISGNVFEQFIGSYPVMLPTAMVRTKAIRSCNGFDNSFSMIEEHDCFIKIAKDWKVAYSHASVAYWRLHSKSLTWSKHDHFMKELKVLYAKWVVSDVQFSTNCLEKLKARIAVHDFYYVWKIAGKANRISLLKNIRGDWRVLIVFFLSLFGLKIYTFFMRKIGRLP